MGISRDDINNKVRILKGKREEEEQREVSPAIPFHIIRNPSLLTNTDLCSPNNSDDEEEEDVDDEEGGEMGTTGLVFGHDESEDESDD